MTLLFACDDFNIHLLQGIAVLKTLLELHYVGGFLKVKTFMYMCCIIFTTKENTSRKD